MRRTEQRRSGDFLPGDGLRQRSTWHVNAGIIQLDVNGERAELRVKVGAHTARNCNELQERLRSTKYQSRSFVTRIPSPYIARKSMICDFLSAGLLFYGFVRSDFAVAYVDDAVRVLRDVIFVGN